MPDPNIPPQPDTTALDESASIENDLSALLSPENLGVSELSDDGSVAGVPILRNHFIFHCMQRLLIRNFLCDILHFANSPS